MNATNNASNALLLYLDSLLSEDDRSVRGGSNSAVEDSELKDCANGGARSSSIRSDTLKLIYFNVACIPVALIHSAVSKVLDVARVSLPSGFSTNGILIRKISHQGQDIRLIDARDIMIPTGHPAYKMSVNDDKAHILVLEEPGFGLICDQVVDSVGVERNQIEWRSQRITRPWLVGMLKEYERALLDETELIRIFRQSI